MNARRRCKSHIQNPRQPLMAFPTSPSGSRQHDVYRPTYSTNRSNDMKRDRGPELGRSEFYRRDLPEERQLQKHVRKVVEGEASGQHSQKVQSSRRHSMGATTAHNGPQRPVLLSRDTFSGPIGDKALHSPLSTPTSAVSSPKQPSSPRLASMINPLKRASTDNKVTDPRKRRQVAETRSAHTATVETPRASSPHAALESRTEAADSDAQIRPNTPMSADTVNRKQASHLRPLQIEDLFTSIAVELGDVQVTAEEASVQGMIAQLIAALANLFFAAAVLIQQREHARVRLDHAIREDSRNKTNFKNYTPLIEQGEAEKEAAEEAYRELNRRAELAIQKKDAFSRNAVSRFSELFFQLSTLRNNKKIEPQMTTESSSSPPHEPQLPLSNRIQELHQLIQRLDMKYDALSWRVKDNNLDGRLSELQSQVERAYGDREAIDKRVNDLNSKLEQKYQHYSNTESVKIEEVEKSLGEKVLALEKRLSKLEASESTQFGRQNPQINFESLEGRVKALEKKSEARKKEFKELKEINHELTAVKPLSTRIDVLQSALHACENSTEKTLSSVRGLEERVKAISEQNSSLHLSRSLGEKVSTIVKQNLSSLASRTDCLSTQLAAVDQARQKDFSELEKDIGQLRKDFGGLERDFDSTNEQRNELVISEVKSLSRALDASKQVEQAFGVQLSDITGKVKDLEQGLEQKIRYLVNHIDLSASSTEAEHHAQTPATSNLMVASRVRNELAALRTESTAFRENFANLSRNLDSQNQRIESNIQAIQAQGHSVEAQTRSLGALDQKIDALDHSIRTINARFNNLTTDHMVQAMARQFSIMYPYAATAQAELIKVREDRVLQQEFVKTLDEKVKEQGTQLQEQLSSIETVRKLYNDRTSTNEDLKERIDWVEATLKQLDQIQQQHDEELIRIEKIETAQRNGDHMLNQLIEQITSARDSFQQQLSTVKTKLKELEPQTPTTIPELSKEVPTGRQGQSAIVPTEDVNGTIRVRNTQSPQKINLSPDPRIQGRGERPPQNSSSGSISPIRDQDHSSDVEIIEMRQAGKSTRTDLASDGRSNASQDDKQAYLRDWTCPLPRAGVGSSPDHSEKDGQAHVEGHNRLNGSTRRSPIIRRQKPARGVPAKNLHRRRLYSSIVTDPDHSSDEDYTDT